MTYITLFLISRLLEKMSKKQPQLKKQIDHHPADRHRKNIGRCHKHRNEKAKNENIGSIFLHRFYLYQTEIDHHHNQQRYLKNQSQNKEELNAEQQILLDICHRRHAFGRYAHKETEYSRQNYEIT